MRKNKIKLMVFIWTMCAIVFLSCPSNDTMEIPQGLYSASANKFVGLYQIKILPNNKAIYKCIVSQHLPPAELENIKVDIKFKTEKTFCIHPAPTTIEACMIYNDSLKSITIIKDEEEIILNKMIIKE